MQWQTEHRRDSPYPLRHHGTNVHIVEQRGNEATFASYIHVTQVVDLQVVGVPGGIVRGAVRRRRQRACASASSHVVLDTMTSAAVPRRAFTAHLTWHRGHRRDQS